MPGLPPISIDDFRTWAAAEWEKRTKPVVDDLSHAVWDFDAQKRLDDTFSQVRSWFPAPAPAPPEPQASAFEAPAAEPPPLGPQPVAPPVATPAPEPEVMGPPSPDLGQRARMTAQDALGGVGDAPGAAGDTLGGLNQQATGQLNDWAAQAQRQLDGLGQTVAPAASGAADVARYLPGNVGPALAEDVLAGTPTRLQQGLEASPPGQWLGERNAATAASQRADDEMLARWGRGDFTGQPGVPEGVAPEDWARDVERMGWLRETGENVAGGLQRGQRGVRMPRLSPEELAQRARDGAAEQRVFDAIQRLWRRGPAGEAAADDLRFLAVGKGEAGEAAARDYLSGKGLGDALPAADAGRATPGTALGLGALGGLGAAARGMGDALGSAAGAVGDTARTLSRYLPGNAGPALAEDLLAGTPYRLRDELAANASPGLADQARHRAEERQQYEAFLDAMYAGHPENAPTGERRRQLVDNMLFNADVGQSVAGSSLKTVGPGRAAGPVAAVARQPSLAEAPGAAALTAEERALLSGPRPTDPAGASNWDRLVAWMTSNALSNPRSLTGNALGGVEQTGGRFGKYVTQGRPQDAWRELGAWWGARGDVGEAFWNALWKGERPPGVAATVGATAEASPQAFSGPKGLLLTPANRIAGATDAFFSTLARAGGEAVADARGLSGAERAAFLEEQVRHAVLAGTPSAITKALGDVKAGINSPRLGDKVKAAAAIVYAPFARVPETILRQGIQRTVSPVTDLAGMGYHLATGNRGAAADAARRWAVNSAVAGTALYEVGQGNLTGSGPSDFEERRRWEALGWRPNSVRLGGNWYSYDFLGPLGTQLNALATAAETWADAGKEPDADGWKRLDKTVNRMGALARDEFYLRNFFDLMDAVKNGNMTDSLEKTAAEAGARLLPLSAAQNWLAGGLDPYERETETPLERLQARTALRQQLPERLDPTTGEPQRRAGTPAERLGGFGRTTTEQTPLAVEVARLKEAKQEVSIPAFSPGERYKDVDQTPAQRRVLQQAYGSEVNQATRDLLGSKRYQEADDAEKARLLRGQLSLARSRADVVAGDRVARSAKDKAARAYAAVPHYLGVKGTPDEIRRGNLETAHAKSVRSDYRRRYGGDVGEARFRREQPELSKLTVRDAVDADVLAAKKKRIEQEYGVDLP